MLFKGQERCEKCVLLLKVGENVVVHVSVMLILKLEKQFIYWLSLQKNELENLTKEERNELKKLIEILEENL